MRVVVAGSGEVCFHIAEHLDCLVVQGEAGSLQVLEETGMGSADTFIAVTDLDEVNMISCLVVDSEFDVPVKIARVQNVAYKKSAVFRHGLRAIDYIVNPEIEAVRAIMNTVEQGASSDVLVFEDTDIQLRSIYVDERSFFKDKTLKDIRQKLQYNFIIAGISRLDELFRCPDPYYFCRGGDGHCRGALPSGVQRDIRLLPLRRFSSGFHPHHHRLRHG